MVFMISQIEKCLDSRQEVKVSFDNLVSFSRKEQVFLSNIFLNIFISALGSMKNEKVSLRTDID